MRPKIFVLSVVLLFVAGFVMLDHHELRAGEVNPTSGYRVLDPIHHGNLTVFPVVANKNYPTGEFLTLDEGLHSGDVVVTEAGSVQGLVRRHGAPVHRYEGAEVNRLVLVNNSKRPLLLLAGEIVSGGKQDRVIGKDRIVPVGAEPLPLSVFCVEHGRWNSGSDKFAAGGTIVHPSVREKAAVDQSQAQVWAAVRGVAPMATARPGSAARTTNGAAAISRTEVDSVIASAAPTMSYRKIYESPQLGHSVEVLANELEKRFERATKGQEVIGAVVAFSGEIAWSDVFASSALFKTYWPKLLRSYAVEALSRPVTRESASLDDARDFLKPADGRIREETEPGVYRWRERTEGPAAEIEIEALQPKPLTLHWLKVLRAS